jgi:hypothetical protein
MSNNHEMTSILKKVDLPLDHPDFFKEIFKEIFFSSFHPKNAIEKIFFEDAVNSLKNKNNRLHEGIELRNVLLTRQLATIIIETESGKIDELALDSILNFLKTKGCLLGPFNEADAPYFEHIARSLTLLKENQEIKKIFKSFSRPFNNTFSDNLVRETLGLDIKQFITDGHVKQAVLSAFIFYLRQTVGSCFATAPAIVITQEQPVTFLIDLKELLETGTLKRTFGGHLYAVPISPTFGSASLKKPFFVFSIVNDITLSDGFLNALIKATIIDENISLENQKKELKNILENTFSSFTPSLITIEGVLKQILLRHHSLEESDVKYFKELPKELLEQKIIIEGLNKKTSKLSKSESIAIFKEQFSSAKNYFVSLTENPLLRSWEFTLASFAETKPNFLSWNLYLSLGLESNEEGGIGKVIFSFLSKKFDEYKNLIEETNQNYERVFLEVKALEAQSRLVDTESKASVLKMQYTTRRNEMEALLERREDLVEKTNLFSSFFVNITEFFVERFPFYFQEIYDASMQEGSENFYDDAPAGFRLLFKHGRTNPSLWTLIYTPDEFVDNLARFFVLIENEILNKEYFKNFEKEIPYLFDEIIRHLRSKEFLITAFARIAKANQLAPIKDPLNNLDKIPKKPWVYTSGGSMASLVSCLYGLNHEPSQKAKWVESELELLVFLVDILKEMPWANAKKYVEKSDASLLAFSPTHAYVFKPGLEPFNESWNQEQYTYTWVRDHYILPQKNFFESLYLNDSMIERLIEKISSYFPNPLLLQTESMKKMFTDHLKIYEFGEFFLNQINKLPNAFEVKPYISNSLIDKVLFEMLPFTSSNDLVNAVESIIKRVFVYTKALPYELKEYLEDKSKKLYYYSSKELLDITKACILLIEKKVFFENDLHKAVVLAMKELGFSTPKPILFADANWFNSYFGFVVGPTSSELELWRFDYLSYHGEPLTIWKKWLNGSDKKNWGIYNKPFEYGQ